MTYYLVDSGSCDDHEISVFTDHKEALAYADKCDSMVMESIPPKVFEDCWRMKFHGIKLDSVVRNGNMFIPPDARDMTCFLGGNVLGGGTVVYAKAKAFPEDENGLPDLLRVIDAGIKFMEEYLLPITPKEGE